MNNLFIFIITIITVNKIVQHIHFYKVKLYIYRFNLYNYWYILYSYRFNLSSYCSKHRYNVTLLTLVNHLNTKVSKSHVTELMNFQNLPELIQHARTGTELMSPNSDIYYHISAKHQGYDAFSFHKDDLDRIIIEKDISLMTFYEKKMVTGNNLKFSHIERNFYDKYSVPNVEGFLNTNQGARPTSVDFLELGAYFREDYDTLVKLDLSKFKETTIVIEDYSDVFEKVVLKPEKRSGLHDGTIISDSEFEHLNSFCNLLNENAEICLIMNDLLDKNPLFPLIIG